MPTARSRPSGDRTQRRGHSPSVKFGQANSPAHLGRLCLRYRKGHRRGGPCRKAQCSVEAVTARPPAGHHQPQAASEDDRRCRGRLRAADHSASSALSGADRGSSQRAARRAMGRVRGFGRTASRHRLATLYADHRNSLFSGVVSRGVPTLGQRYLRAIMRGFSLASLDGSNPDTASEP